MARLFLVRHAHAGDREKWQGDDRLRPLTDKGRAQARGLARQLGADDVQDLASSPYLRCVQTLEPLAEARGLSIDEDDRLAEGSDWREAMAAAHLLRQPTAWCSQGDVIGGIVMHLVEMGVVKSSVARWQKGSTWILDLDRGSVMSARYLEPPG